MNSAKSFFFEHSYGLLCRTPQKKKTRKCVYRRIKFTSCTLGRETSVKIQFSHRFFKAQKVKKLHSRHNQMLIKSFFFSFFAYHHNFIIQIVIVILESIPLIRYATRPPPPPIFNTHKRKQLGKQMREKRAFLHDSTVAVGSSN